MKRIAALVAVTCIVGAGLHTYAQSNHNSGPYIISAYGINNSVNIVATDELLSETDKIIDGNDLGNETVENAESVSTDDSTEDGMNLSDSEPKEQDEHLVEEEKIENQDGNTSQTDLLPLEEPEEKVSIKPLEITGEETLSWPEVNEKIGTLSSSDLGIENLALYWSMEQKYVDGDNSAIMTYYSNLPGDLSGHSLIGDHNYQTGKLFAQAKYGDIISVKTSYGEFVYQCVGSQFGRMNDEHLYCSSEMLEERGLYWDEHFTSDIVLENGEWVLESAVQSEEEQDGRLFVYTCYPLNAVVPEKYLVIEFQLVEGVELVP